MSGHLRAAVLIDDPVTARVLGKLLEPGRRQAARDGWQLPGDTQRAIAALEKLAAGGDPVPVEQPPTRWISTAEAAEVLGISTRATRNLAGVVRTTTIAGRRYFDAADVADELAAREAAGSRGKPGAA